MSGDRDPCGYYAALGVGHSATSDEIKSAFKAKAQQFHPDRNPAPEATRQFQFVNEAYQALGEPKSRADYDAQSYRSPEESSPSADRSPDPVVCSICHRTTAQPRYAIYRHVVSAVFITWRGVRQGVFCSECGAKLAYRASLKTWLAGWWGIPWGPIYSAHAIFSNMFGGQQPPKNNFRLLSWQAVYFAQVGRMDLARAVARDALAFADKIPVAERSSDPRTDRVLEAMSALGAGTGGGSHAPVLKDLWGRGSKAFKVQFAGAAVFTILIAAAALLAYTADSAAPKVAYRHVPPTEEAAPVVPPVPTFNEALVPPPATGKIRALWKTGSRTVLAPLKVVTAPNSPNYYVKVVNWETHAPKLVFFVRSGETASVRVPVGVYEVRFAAGEKWYGEEYLFGPATAYSKADARFDFRAEDGKVDGFTVELIKQISGNLNETAIGPADF
jgi:hypothetical protein